MHFKFQRETIDLWYTYNFLLGHVKRENRLTETFQISQWMHFGVALFNWARERAHSPCPDEDGQYVSVLSSPAHNKSSAVNRGASLGIQMALASACMHPCSLDLWIRRHCPIETRRWCFHMHRWPLDARSTRRLSVAFSSGSLDYRSTASNYNKTNWTIVDNLAYNFSTMLEMQNVD